MSPGPLTLEDRIAIDDLFAAYAWSADRGRMEPFLALFTHDARIVDPVYGPYDGPDRAGPRRFLEIMHENHTFPGRQHWMHNRVYDGDGERCVVRSFILVPHMNPVGTASVLLAFLGHCRDTFVKLDGAWRYEERLVERWAGDVLDGFPDFGPVA